MLKEKTLLNIFDSSLFIVKYILEKSLRDKEIETQRLLEDLPASQGKFIRALFVIIGGSFGSIDKEQLFHIAAAVELLHMATLSHDDIVDDAQLRRGKQTINSSYGVKAALFTGDYLFSQSYILFSQNTSLESIANVSKTIKTICRGEINQFFSTTSFNSSIKEYLKRINGKCASLFSLSLSIAAYEGKAHEAIVKKLERIGYYTGMAFQIIDDILDLTSVDDTLGKPAGHDLRQGIYTLPVLYEIKNGNRTLQDFIFNNDIEKSLELIRVSEGLEKSRQAARKYTQKALTLLQQLPDITEKKVLKLLIERMLLREY